MFPDYWSIAFMLPPVLDAGLPYTWEACGLPEVGRGEIQTQYSGTVWCFNLKHHQILISSSMRR